MKTGWSSDLKDEQEFIEGEVWVGRSGEEVFQAEEGIVCVNTSGTGRCGGDNEKLREEQFWTEWEWAWPGDVGGTAQGWCFGLALTVRHRSQLGLPQLPAQ